MESAKHYLIGKAKDLFEKVLKKNGEKKNDENFAKLTDKNIDNDISTKYLQSEISKVDHGKTIIEKEKEEISNVQREKIIDDNDVEIIDNTNLKQIVVIGPTGAGKSTFLNKIFGETAFEIGDELSSKTKNYTPKILDNFEYWDTIGFDDNELTASEILKKTKIFLEKMKKVLMVVYVVPLTTSRFDKESFLMASYMFGLKNLPFLYILVSQLEILAPDYQEKAVANHFNEVIEFTTERMGRKLPNDHFIFANNSESFLRLVKDLDRSGQTFEPEISRELRKFSNKKRHPLFVLGLSISNAGADFYYFLSNFREQIQEEIELLSNFKNIELQKELERLLEYMNSYK